MVPTLVRNIPHDNDSTFSARRDNSNSSGAHTFPQTNMEKDMVPFSKKRSLCRAFI